MKERMLSKGLTIGIIFLFIGISFQSAIAVNPISSDNEGECNLCAKKVSKTHLVRLKSLINRVETLNIKLFVLSKLNPIVAERYQELSERITIFTEVKEEYLSNFKWDFPVICGILKYCFYSTFIGSGISEEIAYWAMEYNFYYIAGIFNCLYILFLFLFFSTIALTFLFRCLWFGSNTSMYMLDCIEVPITSNKNIQFFF